MKHLKNLLPIFAILLLLSACTKTVPAEDMTFSTESGSFFKCFEGNCDLFSLQIKIGSYSEETGEELKLKIAADIATAKDAVNATAQKCTVIVADSYTVQQHALQADDNSFLCTSEQIRTGEYRPALLGALYGLTEPWQQYGLCCYVFGDDESIDLKAYYAKAENLPTLSLFAAFLNPTFADEQTISAAKATAAAFTRYLLSAYDFNSFKSCGFSEEYRNKWLASIGVVQTYASICDFSYLDGLTYSKTSEYGLVMKKNNHTFYLNPLDDLQTPTEVACAFENYYTGMENMLSYIEQNAPKTYPKIQAAWDSKLSFYINYDAVNSYQIGDAVIIWRLGDWFHETAHLFTARATGSTECWKEEGIATYLNCFTGSVFDTDGMYQLYHVDLSKQEPSAAKDALQWVMDYYNLHKTTDDYDALLFVNGFGLFPGANPNADVTGFEIITRSCAERRNQFGENWSKTNGNELTYSQACMLLEYMIEQYDLDRVLEYCMSMETYEEFFGGSYAEAFAAAEAFYMK